MSPLLHHCLRARTRRTEVLLGFDTLAFPDCIDATDEFANWQDGRLCASILATRRTREFLPYVYPVVVVIELSSTSADIMEDK